jgi:mono/diheme cytochrome c family protein
LFVGARSAFIASFVLAIPLAGCGLGGQEATAESTASGASQATEQSQLSGEQKAKLEKPSGNVSRGEELVTSNGCIACHSVDGSTLVGPTWQKVLGSQELLADGTTITVDLAYIRQSILQPEAKLVKGFDSGLMPTTYSTTLSDQDVDDMVAFIASR